MTMASNNDLASHIAEFVNSGGEIVYDSMRFKRALGIGKKAYKLLSAQENLGICLHALATGTAVGGGSAIYYISSLGFWAKIATTVGLATVPVLMFVATGVSAGAIYIGGQQFISKVITKGTDEIPKFINTPLDVIATALIEVMLPISLKVYHADGEISEPEEGEVTDFFCDHWGYSPEFVKCMSDWYSPRLNDVSYDLFANGFIDYCKENPDCNSKRMKKRFLEHLVDIVKSDGIIHPKEQAEIDKIRLLVDGENTRRFRLPKISRRK